MLFAVCSDRGAPGSTTLALALASARGLPSVVVEADPYGGDLGLRCRIGGDPVPPTPTVLGLGAGRVERQPGQRALADTAGHEGGRHLDLWRDGSHQLSNLVRVVPGFLTAEQGASMAWASVAATVENQTVPVFADLGRIHTGSPSMPIASAADALIPVCRGDMTSVQHMLWRLEQLVPAIAERNGRPPVVVPVVLSSRRNGATAANQVAHLLGETAVAPTLGGVGWLAWDPASAIGLAEGGDPWAKPLRNSPLMKSARKVMWLLGLATGLDHHEPDTAGTRARRRTSIPEEPQPANIAAAGIAATADFQQPDPPVPAAAPAPPSPAAPVQPEAVRPAPLPEQTVGTANGHTVNGLPTGGPSFEGLRRSSQTAPVGEED